MKKNIFKLSFLFILGINNLYGQKPADQSSKYYKFDPEENGLFITPDVAAFQKSNFFDVNLYTGKTEMTIPFYTIQEGDISIPISINYNSGGVKIEEIASNVGTGWSLNAGGNIIRSIKDIEDNNIDYGAWGRVDRGFEGEYDTEDYSYISVKGYFRQESELSTSTMPRFYNAYGIAKEDASPDIFTAIAPGLNSKFILSKRTEESYSPIFLDGNGNIGKDIFRGKININSIGFDNRQISGLENVHNLFGDKNRPIGTPWIIGKDWEKKDYTGFHLTNTNGIKYEFNQLEYTEAISNYVPGGWMAPNAVAMVRLIEQIQKAARDSHKRTIDAWHLSTISDNKTNKQVNFSYETYSKPTTYQIKNNTNDALRSDANPKDVYIYGVTNKYAFGHLPNFQNKEHVNISESRIKNQYYYSKGTQINRIKKITWSQGEVEFIYGLVRQDNYDNEKALSEIIVRDYNGNKIKHFKFHYTYFNSKENCSQWQCKRLRLDAIQQISNDNKKTEPYYKFDYYYDHPLPKVNSLQQDFLGYYNNNGVEKSTVETEYKSPVLYYHKNQGKYSILPFQRTDGTFTKTIPGQFSLAPNNYSLTGLLKKVTFPTGGTSDFEYENHRFLFNGIEYVAGGARIKKQILNDSNGSTRILNYDYTENGRSSGYVNNFSIYGYPWGYDSKKTSNNVSFITYDKAKGNIELTDGSYVGYSKVKVTEAGNGFTEFSFSSPKDFPNEYDQYLGVLNEFYLPNVNDVPNYINSDPINFLLNNSSYPDINYINNDVRRSKLLTKKIYNQDSELLKEEINNYEYKAFNEIPLDYQVILDSYFPSTANNPEPDNFKIGFKSKLRVERNLLSKQETKEYLDGGIVTNTKEITYDAVYPFVKQEKTINSKDEILITDNEYVFERTDELSKRLTDDNRVSEPLRTVYKNEDHIISSTYNHYSDFNGIIQKAHILQKSKALVEYSDANARKISYDSYDTKGNLTQYTLENGIPVSIIWGYKGQYPIAKIEGSTNTELSNYIQLAEGNIQSNNDTYELIFEKIREHFPNSMITTYLYQPLVGVTSITAPNGQTEYYKYDEFGRLVEIRNDKKEVIKTFEYKYKP
ncbi:RHS repeat domain-containing protein [Empedobacter brevis]|uniref:RHS repeat domain-containing protein n=1 Tax=Empedobacter brevis TaxID=247 RepID=UPI00131F7568|nr:RHS repeat domain-containing protein [Empedobacter brevis]QHC84631.1 hypothetical protein AS589_07435 [Empedobacter brevis]